jgi:hypothetical protein
MLATGTLATVTSALAVRPSTVAVISAVPADSAVASPDPETDTTAEFELDQVICRPLSALPVASCGVAVNWRVPPTVRLALVGEMVTDATGIAETVTEASATLPSTEAVIVAVPGESAVATPDPETDTTVGFEVDQVT